MPATDFLAVIHALIEHGVDFIVVGGVSAVLEGAPMSTFDLDIVHSRNLDNVLRLSTALAHWMPTIDCNQSVGFVRRSHIWRPQVVNS
jgi:hypothetical protein